MIGMLWCDGRCDALCCTEFSVRNITHTPKWNEYFEERVKQDEGREAVVVKAQRVQEEFRASSKGYGRERSGEEERDVKRCGGERRGEEERNVKGCRRERRGEKERVVRGYIKATRGEKERDIRV